MNVLKPYRDRIDALDDQIVPLLVQRLAVIREVAALKSREGIPAVLEDRVRQVIDRAASAAGGDDTEMVRELYTLLVTICCDLEERIMTAEPAPQKLRSV